MEWDQKKEGRTFSVPIKSICSQKWARPGRSDGSHMLPKKGPTDRWASKGPYMEIEGPYMKIQGTIYGHRRDHIL